MKLVVREMGSVELDAEWRRNVHVSPVTSIVGRIELERVSRRQADFDVERLDTLLAEFDFLPLHVANAAVAASVRPPSLKSLDAVHLATLLEVAGDIEAFYCYDQRLADAAREHGIEVRSPGLAA